VQWLRTGAGGSGGYVKNGDGGGVEGGDCGAGRLKVNEQRNVGETVRAQAAAARKAVAVARWAAQKCSCARASQGEVDGGTAVVVSRWRTSTRTGGERAADGGGV
jgi:hypothetical protein